MRNFNDITNKSIFGTYKLPEDRITAALLHILNLGGMSMIEYVFEDAFDSNYINGIFAQTHKHNTRIDGEIYLNLHLLIECKIKDWSVNKQHNEKQLLGHIQQAKADNAVLVYLIKDTNIPNELIQNKVFCMNWFSLLRRLREYRPCFNSELMTYLIDQFDLLLHNSFDTGSTIPESKNVIIVGGHWGESVAEKYHFYSCQYDRKFRPAKFIAFYHKKRIHSIYEIVDGPHKINTLLAMQDKNFDFQDYFTNQDPTYLQNTNKKCQFFQLDSHNLLQKDIVHDKQTAFVRNQRYANIDVLLKIKDTSELP